MKICNCSQVTECAAYILTYNQGHSQRYLETCTQVWTPKFCIQNMLLELPLFLTKEMFINMFATLYRQVCRPPKFKVTPLLVQYAKTGMPKKFLAMALITSLVWQQKKAFAHEIDRQQTSSQQSQHVMSLLGTLFYQVIAGRQTPRCVRK